MALSDLVTVTITSETGGLTQVGFGTILFATYHTEFPERDRVYTDLAGLTADGFETWSPTYRMAQKLLAQSPRLPQFKVGRLANAYTQQVRFTPVTKGEGYVHTLTFEAGGEGVETIEYEEQDSDTVALIIDGLVAAHAAVGSTLVTAVDNTTNMQINTDQGVMCFYSAWSDSLKFEDITADPGVAADLDAIRLYDADWYGLAVDCNSNPIIEETADWAETQDVVFGAQSSDWVAQDGGSSTDIFSELAAKEYFRTLLLFDLDETAGYSGVAALAKTLVLTPGSYTLHGRTLAGVTADKLTPTQKTALRTKGANVYISTAGTAHVLGGNTPSGEFFDVVVFRDWLRIRMQERIAGVILGNNKVPYNDTGISLLGVQVEAQLQDGVNAGGINAGQYTVTLPTAKSQNPNDKDARILKGIKWRAELSGAIHLVEIEGTLTLTL